MPREPNTVPTVQITVSTTPQIRQYLEELAKSGLWGKNAAEAAERLIAQAVMERVDNGKLQLPPNENETDPET